MNECMTYRNRLKTLGADNAREFFIQKLLDVDKEYMIMRASLRTQTPEQIVAALMEQYQLFQRHKENDRRGGQVPAGLNRPKFNRPRGQGRPPAVAVAAIGAVGGEHVGKSAHPEGCITSSEDRVIYVLECAASLITPPLTQVPAIHEEVT